MRILLLLFLLPSLAFASEKGVSAEASADASLSSSTQVDVGGQTMNAGKALGLANSLGDVDIYQCLGSTQWNTILVGKQKLVLNKWCAAEAYEERGMHTMASMLRCDIEEIAKHFSSQEVCIAAHEIAPPPAPAPANDEWKEEQMQMQRSYDTRIAKLEEELKRPKPKPQVIKKTVVEKRATLSKELAEELKVKK